MKQYGGWHCRTFYNFRHAIRLSEHKADDGNSEKGVTDEHMDWTIHKAAWSQLKTIGCHSYATSSSEHYFVAICEFKMELQSRTA